MKGTTGTRLWRVHKDAGRPWPVIDDDDVIDYMVMEAISLKVRKEDEAARKKAELEVQKREARERLKQYT